MNSVRPLVLFGVVSAFLLLIYYTFSQSVVYPIQTISKEEAIQTVSDFVQENDFEPYLFTDAAIIETVANESIGRYIQEAGWTTEEIEAAGAQIPFYDIVLTYGLTSFYIDPLSNELIGVDGLDIAIHEENQLDELVSQMYGPGFEFETTEAGEFGSTIYTYSKGKVIGDIEEKVRVNVSMFGDRIEGFKRFGVVDGFPLKKDFQLGEIGSMIIFFVLLVVIFIAVTIQLVRKLLKREIEVVVWPIIIALFAGFGWVYTSYVAMGMIEIFTVIFAVAMTYITAVILILTGKKTNYKMSLNEKISSFKPAVLNGFLLMLISTVLVELFYFFAMKWGAWASPVMDNSIFLNASLMGLPFFAFFMGVSAAISEEAIFRRYLIPIFKRLGVIIATLLTSYLWAIGHVGYHLFPWYIRIIEFVLIVGPFFYFVYQRYGFLTVIFCHFFYNSFFGAIFLLGVDRKVGILAIALTMCPFLVFLKKNHSSNLNDGKDEGM